MSETTQPDPDSGDDQVLPLINPNVVFCEVDGGAVLLSTESEVYFGLNEVGACIWQMLPPHHTTLRALCDNLLAEYPDAPPQDIAKDVRELLGELRKFGLVTDAPS